MNERQCRSCTGNHLTPHRRFLSARPDRAAAKMGYECKGRIYSTLIRRRRGGRRPTRALIEWMASADDSRNGCAKKIGFRGCTEFMKRTSRTSRARRAREHDSKLSPDDTRRLYAGTQAANLLAPVSRTPPRYRRGRKSRPATSGSRVPMITARPRKLTFPDPFAK